ncbi:MAG: class I SAM-dependent methyltransferase [Byssovorax sp.]
MISFSFGKNWLSYVARMTEEDIQKAMGDIASLLGKERIKGARVVDIGSGSGIHSLSFYRLGAGSVASYDIDPHSVEATTKLWTEAGKPENWTVARASILDDDWVKKAGTFDIVYSWGVLHHTGSMWKAIDNALSLCRPGGTVFLALYTKGSMYPKDLALKEKYNRSSDLGKRAMEARFIARYMWGELRWLRNPLGWNKPTTRGMNTYVDLVDWLGGLPYEVASIDEVLVHLREKGFTAERIVALGEGSCSSYVFTKTAP